jgi:hypothetical protein
MGFLCVSQRDEIYASSSLDTGHAFPRGCFLTSIWPKNESTLRREAIVGATLSRNSLDF